MLGKPKQFEDTELGVFSRRGGVWRGNATLDPHGPIPLTIPGSRSEPDDAALVLARSIQSQYDHCRTAIIDALNDHRLAALGGDRTDGDHANPEPMSIAIIELGGLLTVQLAYQVDWDDDHTLGACLRDGALVELNGSILEP